jgi:hypothetical protein
VRVPILPPYLRVVPDDPGPEFEVVRFACLDRPERCCCCTSDGCVYYDPPPEPEPRRNA